jgi:DNA-binding response OmpR family regulator
MVDIMSMLKRQGYAVFRCSSVRRALVLALDGGVKAIFVRAGTLRLRQLLALEKCRRVRPRTSVIIVSGSDALEDTAFDRGSSVVDSWPMILHWPAPQRTLLDLVDGER